MRLKFASARRAKSTALKGERVNIMSNGVKLIGRCYDVALAFVYPQACAICGASVERRADWPCCAQCWAATHQYSGQEAICRRCGAETPEGIRGVDKNDVWCRRCDEENFSAARAVGRYAGALRAAVLMLKRRPHIGARLAQALHTAQCRAPLDSATRIVPVPLHPQRERVRGYNQAEKLAAALAARARLPLDTMSLRRTHHSERNRAGMDAHARREGVREAFRVERARLIAGERILLVDDVFTTGATVGACAVALKAAGAEEVFVLTVARVGLYAQRE